MSDYEDQTVWYEHQKLLAYIFTVTLRQTFQFTPDEVITASQRPDWVGVQKPAVWFQAVNKLLRICLATHQVASPTPLLQQTEGKQAIPIPQVWSR